MMQDRKVPESTIKRLPVYLRTLDNLIRKDVDLVNSDILSEETAFTAELIRKDFSFFGAFGIRGRGYYTENLRQNILKVTGLDKPTIVIVVGAGYLGIALARFNITKNPYTKIVSVFDINPAIIGNKIIDVEIMHVSKMAEIVRKYTVDVAILAVPLEQAQVASNNIVQSGVKVIFNFVPVTLDVPDGIHVHNIDLSVELQTLKYYTFKIRAGSTF